MTTRYQRGNQKPSIEEGQTTLWLQDTKGVIRSRQSKKYRQRNSQRKSGKGQIAIYKSLYRKLKIEQNDPTKI
jgi:hypothetical protein